MHYFSHSVKTFTVIFYSTSINVQWCMLIYLGWILLLGFNFDIWCFAETWKAVSKFKYNLILSAQKPPERDRPGQAHFEQPEVWNSGLEGNIINSTIVIPTSMSHISKVWLWSLHLSVFHCLIIVLKLNVANKECIWLQKQGQPILMSLTSYLQTRILFIILFFGSNNVHNLQN